MFRRKREIDPARYVTAKTYGDLGCIEHLDGVAHDDAPIPRRWHRCWPQTRIHGGETDLFCPCGGQKTAGRWNWVFRNMRHPRTPAQQAEHERGRRIDALIQEFHEAEAAGDRQRVKRILAEVKPLIDDLGVRG